LHLAWMEKAGANVEVMYASQAPSSGWSSPINISKNSAPSEKPRLAVGSDGTVHAVWQDHAPGNFDVFYASKPPATGWTSPINIANTPGDSIRPEIALDSGGTPHVVWYDYTPGRSDIFYTTRSADGSWLAPLNISKTPAQSGRTSIVADSQDRLHVVWTEKLGGQSDVFYVSKDPGGQWSTPVDILPTPGESGRPHITVDKLDGLHVVWGDGSEGKGNFQSSDFEVYYARRPVGRSWTAPTNLSHNSGISGGADVAVDGQGGIHVAWNDQTLGNFEIFYTYTPDPGPLPIVRDDSFEWGRDSDVRPPVAWFPTNLGPTDVRALDAVVGDWSFQITGDPALRKSLTQNITVVGQAGDVLTLSGFSKREGGVDKGGIYAVQAKIFYADATTQTVTASFSKTNHDWELSEQSLTAPKPYKKVSVAVIYQSQTGTARFDEVKVMVTPAAPLG
jgi:hypothetical protein